MTTTVFPKRTIHLDFHTSPDIGDVGRDFDPDVFAQTFVDAHVDSVTLFAKCHHGHLYYDTDRAERHPGLPRDLDLLGEQVKALHARGIRAPIYISGPVDAYAETQHPEWRVVLPDGGAVGAGPLDAGWGVLDMSSPYQDYLADQITEVLDRFAPTDGIFIDMCWDQVSLSTYAIDSMREKGFDPESEADRARHARIVALDYMDRFKRMVDEAHVGHPPAGIWYNSRPKVNLDVEVKFLRHAEIESLPTGGWGYAYYPYVSRYVRPFGLPTLSHTARFHRTWGDFGGLKPEGALRYECCLMIAQGITSCVGDQLHPRGTTDEAAYGTIGRVYDHIESCEPYVEGCAVQSQIAVLIDPERGDSPGPVGQGIVRALSQLRHQFDVLPADRDFSAYDLVIVPEMVDVTAELREQIRAYVVAGGAVLISGDAALDADGNPVMDELGITTDGDSPFTTTYLRAAGPIADALPPMDHAMYERGFRMKPADGAENLCSVIEPYFERTWEHYCSHGQTPPATPSEYSAVVRNGRVITFAQPIFTAYGKHANVPYRQLLGACIDLLLPEPLMRAGGPAHLETTVVARPGRTVVHLVSFLPERRAEGLDIVEDPFPLVDVPVSVRLDSAPKRAFLAPDEHELPFEYRDGYAHVSVTELTGHTMVVFDD
jgi:hypothetical protein